MNQFWYSSISLTPPLKTSIIPLLPPNHTFPLNYLALWMQSKLVSSLAAYPSLFWICTRLFPPQIRRLGLDSIISSAVKIQLALG